MELVEGTVEHFEEALERVDLIILQSTSSTLCIPILKIYTRFVSYGRCWTRTMVCCVVLCCVRSCRWAITRNRWQGCHRHPSPEFTIHTVNRREKQAAIDCTSTIHRITWHVNFKISSGTTLPSYGGYIPVAVRDIAEIAPLRGYVVSTVVRKMMRTCSCTFGPTVKYSILL